jgi:hypothetical protein
MKTQRLVISVLAFSGLLAQLGFAYKVAARDLSPKPTVNRSVVESPLPLSYGKNMLEKIFPHCVKEFFGNQACPRSERKQYEMMKSVSTIEYNAEQKQFDFYVGDTLVSSIDWDSNKQLFNYVRSLLTGRSAMYNNYNNTSIILKNMPYVPCSTAIFQSCGSRP